MTKSKAKKAKQAKTARGQMPKAKAVRQPSPNHRLLLDKGAAEWARLLDDPCGANLVYPCYPTGSGGSVLMRFEADGIIAAGATETAVIYGFTPGALRGFINTTPLTSDTLGSTLSLSSGLNPGGSFITNNANSFRPVAACMQVMYPGTELNRSGVVGVGLTDGSVFANNLSTADGGSNINTTAAQVRTLTQHVERMPVGVVEVKWFPSSNDEANIGTQVQQVSTSNAVAGRNTLFMTASGFPVSTGIRVRIVAVYELSFGSGTGQIAGAVTPVSSNTPAQVLRALASRDKSWYIESAAKLGKAVGTAISYAAAGYKAYSAFAAGAALM